MIASGEKKEEYRECKPYFHSRLRNKGTYTIKHFDFVTFKNGYSKDAPTITLKFIETQIRWGKQEWGAIPGEIYYVIMLGDIVK